jgi:hydrogenase maturation protein HypF
MQSRREIRVSGIVQGVGFRPYVYRLATELELTGAISNTSAGATIEIQGAAESVEAFVNRLPQEAPALARVIGIAIRELPCTGDNGFQILPSRANEPARTLISPDVAVCDDCLRELFDPANRRYLYPFINCTNCGPRFTIVRDIPYDRCRTSMAGFAMCEACLAEYGDPDNRRFHAQPNACWDCGPQLELLDSRGLHIETKDPLAEAARRLDMGQVLALKGLGGFHLAVDATNSFAVARLRERKHREEKPFAVMVPDLQTAERVCMLDDLGRAALLSRERPIVLLPKGDEQSIAEAVAPRQAEFGLFLPYTPLHHLLFAAGGFPALVMTSGNLSEEPIASQNEEALERLAGIADLFLVHNREILVRCDDSVVRPRVGRVLQLRRSRGYVPAAISWPEKLPPVLAVGGELKNTICLTRGRLAFLSQHIGDLENAQSFEFFREAVEHLSRVLEIEPQIIAYDLHPEYLSTKWALEQQGILRIGVQHHHAHIASCMAENGITGKVIGFALDGTGYGTDGNVWGGEALLADFTGFVRAAHFAYVPMPGGSAAIREPWRMAVGYLASHFGSEFLNWNLGFLRDLDRKNVQMMLRMIEGSINCPLTSSCGRLFDAVAAVIGVRNSASYEAQAAIELEARAKASADPRAYSFELRRTDGCWEIGTHRLFEQIIEDLCHTVSLQVISRRFHNGLVAVLVKLAQLLREESSLNRVCLSGGVFHNSLLCEALAGKLQDCEFEVFMHSQVPAGDGGLSLGQSIVAARRNIDPCYKRIAAAQS